MNNIVKINLALMIFGLTDFENNIFIPWWNRVFKTKILYIAFQLEEKQKLFRPNEWCAICKFVISKDLSIGYWFNYDLHFSFIIFMHQNLLDNFFFILQYNFIDLRKKYLIYLDK